MERTIRQFLACFPDVIASRGQAIYENGDYVVYSNDDEIFDCDVFGVHDNYQVKLFLEDDKIVDAECDCPYYEEGHLCKHIYAAALALSESQPHLNHKDVKIVVPSDEKEIVSKYKEYYSDNVFTKQSMAEYLQPLIQGQKRNIILSLCKLTKRKSDFNYFLEAIYKSELKEWFFSSLTSNDLPSPLLGYYLGFVQNHDGFSSFVTEEILAAALDKGFGDETFYIPFFEEAMILNQKGKVKLLSDSLKAINYITDNKLFLFLKENEIPENYASYFKSRIEKGQLFKSEYAFLFPYLTEEQKSKCLVAARKNRHSYYYYDYDLNDYAQKRFITEEQICLVNGTSPKSVGDMSLIDFGAFRNSVFRNYRETAIKRFKVVIGGFNRRKQVQPYEVFCAYLVFRDCLDDYPELKVPFERFLDRIKLFRDIPPQIHSYFFELMKKTGNLNQNCSYVDFEDGTTGFDAMDIEKTVVKEETKCF